jgi:hypothetical protein
MRFAVLVVAGSQEATVALRIVGTEPTDPFERTVFRGLSKAKVDGILQANVMVPNVDYGFDEQDIVVVCASGICTIDAKAYEPGEYHGGLNQPLLWRRTNDQDFTPLPTRLAKPLSVAANKGKKIVSYLKELCKVPEVGLRNLPKEIRVLSLIVVPDHADISAAELSKQESLLRIIFPCKMLVLSELNSFVERELSEARTYKNPADLARITQGFASLLSDWVPRAEVRRPRIGDVLLTKRISSFDGDVPGETWRGSLDGEPVFVKVFFKYPWREESGPFFRGLSLQARALQKARLPRVVSLNGVHDYPQYFVMVYEWFENEGSLEEAVGALHGLGLTDSIAIITRVAETLQLLHENPGRAGVILRGLHPRNVLLRRWVGSVDWRTAEFLIVGFDRATVIGRSSVGYDGTSPYDAPEMWGHGGGSLRNLPSVDVYSLGMLFRFLVSGREPDASQPDRRELPPTALGVILRATQQNPAGRYESVAEFIRAIGDIPGRR